MADKMNYYDILGVTLKSTDKEITKAYRKKALKCHPDKNPDNAAAADLFHQLSKALEVLTDSKARAAYDAVLKAKERAKLRTKALDAKRKKFKQDLEQQEDAAKSGKENDEVAARNLQAEIERLREEGSTLLHEQQELLKAQVKKEQESPIDMTFAEDVTPKLKLRWKSKKSDVANGGYSQELLQTLFEKYGRVSYVIVSSKKKGSAIVEFKSMANAKMALENEAGISDNPLKMSWLESSTTPTATTSETSIPTSTTMNLGGETTFQPKPTEPPYSSTDTVSDRDYESVILMKLRQAEERKRLIQQLAEEDAQ